LCTSICQDDAPTCDLVKASKGWHAAAYGKTEEAAPAARLQAGPVAQFQAGQNGYKFQGMTPAAVVPAAQEDPLLKALGAGVPMVQDRTFHKVHELPAELPSPDSPARACMSTTLRTLEIQVKPGSAVEPGKGSRRTTAQKKKALLKQLQSPEEPITTFMLSNLPCSIDHAQVAKAVDSLGFGRRSVAASKSNLGYGFINFVTPEDAEAFAEAFNGYQFEGTKSSKRSLVRPAAVQGFARSMELFRQSFAKRGFRGSVVCSL